LGLFEQFENAVQEFPQHLFETRQPQAHNLCHYMQRTHYYRVMIRFERIQDKWHERVQSAYHFLSLLFAKLAVFPLFWLADDYFFVFQSFLEALQTKE